jgi:hypothetical protein
VANVLYALLFVPALLAIAFVLVRRPVRVLAEVALTPATISGDVDPIVTLDALLAELEGATVRIDGADELDEHAVVQLERLADKFEAAAAAIERVGKTFEPPVAHRDDVESDREAIAFRMRREPRLGRTFHATLLLLGHRLVRIAVARASLFLHLDEPKLASPPHDQIELVPSRPDVRAEHAPPTQAIPPRRAALPSIH